MPKSDHKPLSRKDRTILLVVGPCFIVVGFYFLYVLVNDSSRYLAFRSAVEVPIAKIRDYQLVNSRGGGRSIATRSSIYIIYEYDFQGSTFTGSHASIYSGGDNFGSFQTDLAGRISRFINEGKPLNCYVLKRDPGQSVIDRSFRLSRCIAPVLFTLAFLYSGSFVSYYAICGVNTARDQGDRSRRTKA